MALLVTRADQDSETMASRINATLFVGFSSTLRISAAILRM